MLPLFVKSVSSVVNFWPINGGDRRVQTWSRRGSTLRFFDRSAGLYWGRASRAGSTRRLRGCSRLPSPNQQPGNWTT